MKVTLSEPTLVYSPPVNENTSQWGVYAIPKLWRHHTGELVVRFNGEQDSGLTQQRVPNLYFISRDNGSSWEELPDGEKIYDTSYFIGINPSFTTLKNGDMIGLHHPESLMPVPDDTPYRYEYLTSDHSMVARAYRYGDLPQESVDISLFHKHGEKISHTKINYDFPERLVAVTVKGYDEAVKNYIPVKKKVQANIFLTPFFSALTELSDGTLLAVCHGQHPDISDRQCEEAYLIASSDGGVTWKKRSTIASDTERPSGCVGDGGEISLTQSANGNLICAMRTDFCKETGTCDTLVCVSSDNGFTWSAPKIVADSSVTPHVVALKDGIVVLIYGRPGVHFKVSQDNGVSWSDPYAIIGKTLQEELAEGNDYMDFMYFKSVSYSNTFIEKLSDDTILVLYNNQRYDDGDGKQHKAAFVRKITVTKE